MDLDQDGQPYDALSYTWGEPVFSEKLYVLPDQDDGDDCDVRVMFITRSLSAALKRLRRPHSVRRIWADAVCINQEDTSEKSEQIPLMSTIYRGASGVSVWLGGSASAEACARSLNVTMRRCLTKRHLVSQAELAESARALEELISLPWFSRRWVIQETVLSQQVTLFCGTERLSWLPLVSMVAEVFPGTETQARAVRSVLAMFDLWKLWAMRHPHNGQCRLSQLLGTFDHFGCADGRDRIYAISGLAEDVHGNEGGLSIVPDYGLSTEKLYTKVAESFVRSGQLLWVLMQASTRRDPNGGASCRTRGLPSWVPDWRLQKARQAFWSNSPLQEAACVERFSDSVHALTADFCYVRTWKWGAFGILDQGKFTSYGARNSGSARVLASPSANYVDLEVSPFEVEWKSHAYSRGGGGVWVLKVIEELSSEYEILEKSAPGTKSADNIEAKSRYREEVLQVLSDGICNSSHHANESFAGSLMAALGELVTDLTSTNLVWLVQELNAMMAGRCLFACRLLIAEPQGTPFPQESPAPRPLLVVGIGPCEARLGDKVVSFSDNEAPKTMWANMYLLRGAVVPASSFSSEKRRDIPDSLTEFTAFELVGDCYLQRKPLLDHSALQYKDWKMGNGCDDASGKVRQVESDVGRMGVFLI